MTKKNISGGVAHKLPTDLQKALTASPDALEAWEDITPLARNEFICWIISAKKDETRARRIRRAKEELLDGHRRPCCWMGCVHRADKKPSASQQWILDKQKGGE